MTESCTTVEGSDNLPAWPQGDGKKDDEPKPTVEPDPKDPPETEAEDNEQKNLFNLRNLLINTLLFYFYRSAKTSTASGTKSAISAASNP